MAVPIVEFYHPHKGSLSPQYKRTLKNVAHVYSPGAVVRLGEGQSTLPPQQWFDWWPNRSGMLQAIVAREMNALQVFDDSTLFLDIETDSSEEMWNQPLEEFFRLGQYAWGEGDVTVTTSLRDVLHQMSKAETIIAHNGHNFDFSVLLGDSALEWAMQGKLFDTWVHATLVAPAPFKYTSRNGHTYVNAAQPSNARRWFSLDNLSFQFGLEGKYTSDDGSGLKALAKKYGGFGKIPLDDPDYLAYAEQDIPALREVARSLLAVPYNPEYARRAQKCAAIDAQMTRNGVRIDLEAAKARKAEQESEAAETLAWLVQEHGFPTEGKQPWKSNVGKRALDRMMEQGGANVSKWPKTASGARSYSGEALKTICEGTPLEETAQRVAVVMGQRTLADQLIQHTHADGRIHPDIDALQVSSRRSTTKPGVTTFGKEIEKTFFISDPGMVMMEFDLDAADARGVAALSGDPNLIKQYTDGVDGHEFVGREFYGDAEYEAHMLPGWETDTEIRKKNPLRQKSKPLGHGYSYGSGAKNLSRVAGVPLSDAQRYISVMRRLFPVREQWFDKVRLEAQKGFITNYWGRKIFIDPDRAYTQAPAMHGQSFTSEMIEDWLLKIYDAAPEVIRWICFGIHDALLIQLPEDKVDYYSEVILNCAKREINGVPMLAAKGQPAKNWGDCAH